MKFSELDINYKELTFFEYFYDEYMGKKIDEYIKTSFENFKNDMFKKYRADVSLREHGNLEFNNKITFVEKTSVLIEFNIFINSCIEKFAFYSEEFDKEIDEYCSMKGYSFNESGELIINGPKINCL